MAKIADKKAVIVKMAVYTRIVVDTTASEDEITEMAIKKICQDPKGYMNGENLEYIKDDTECPYNPETLARPNKDARLSLSCVEDSSKMFNEIYSTP